MIETVRKNRKVNIYVYNLYIHVVLPLDICYGAGLSIGIAFIQIKLEAANGARKSWLAAMKHGSWEAEKLLGIFAARWSTTWHMGSQKAFET